MAPPFLELSSLVGRNGFTIISATPNDRLGFAVIGLGDFNDDGFNDLATLAPIKPSSDPVLERAYVVFGRSHFEPTINVANLDGTNGFRTSQFREDRYSRNSIGAAGDVNGDHVDDLILGMTGNPNTGRAYVLLGKKNSFAAEIDLSTLTNSDGIIYRNGGMETMPLGWGISVGGVGDLNQNGLDDFVIGTYDNGHLVFGQHHTENTVSLVNLDESSHTASELLQQSSGLGDFNGDGIDDLSFGYSHPFRYYLTGESYVAFGDRGFSGSDIDRSTLNGKRGFKFSTPPLSLAGIDDFNGDGLNDLAVASRKPVFLVPSRPDYNYTFSGYVDVVFGSRKQFPSYLSSSSLNGRNGFRIRVGDALNVLVKRGRDINGDKISDLLISVVGATYTSYVIFGRRGGFPRYFDVRNLNGRNGFAIQGYSVQGDLLDPLTSLIDGAGDVNGDGYDDIVLGDAYSDPRAGKTYVIFGGARYGSQHSDRLWGNAKANVIHGFEGSDRLYGFKADDTLLGGSGHDLLHGGQGKDYLIGSTGNDILTGGKGADWFLFDSGTPFNRQLMGIDTIIDFVPQKDKIVLRSHTFTILGSDASFFAAVDTIAQAKVSQASMTYVRPSGELFYNRNGLKPGFGLGGQFAVLTSGLNLTAGDFMIQP